MAEETNATEHSQSAANVTVASVDTPAGKTSEKEPPPEDPAKDQKPVDEIPEPEKKPASVDEVVLQSDSFKEESNRVSDLLDPEKKALEELKQLIRQALDGNEFTSPPPAAPEEQKTEAPPADDKKSASEEIEKEEPVEKPSETANSSAAVVAVAEETVVVNAVDEDGAKTVEAIEESVVSVTAVEPGKETEKAAQPADDQSAAAPPSPAEEKEEILIWGVPILGDERSDVVLLKFLRARDFKAKDAFEMVKNAVRWRKEFGIDALLEEEGLGEGLEKVVFMSGFDREGHPVCYNVYGEFQDKELYQKAFGDEEKRQKFLRWRIQFLEKGIRQLDFSPSGICTIVQVTDLKNSPGPGKRELRQATNQALYLLQDNYPEFVAKQIFINVPWWYLAFNRVISPFLTQRTKSKFLFAGTSKTTETLFKYIAPEQVPVQYGGLSKEDDSDFSTSDAVSEITIKPSSKHTIDLPVSEKCVLVWELRVLGWDVSYCAEFVPDAEDGYTVLVQKSRKMIPTDEPFVKDSFKIGEPGKIVLTVENSTSKKKKLLHRSKTKSFTDTI